MLFRNATVLNGAFQWMTADLLIKDGTIAEIAESIHAPDEPSMDCTGLRLVPGLIDIHTHGAVGFDHTTAPQEGIRAIAEFEAKSGVTSFLPTVMTASEEMMTRAVKTIADYRADASANGAVPLGIHMEGPFFSQAKRGAQPPEWILDPNVAMFRRLNEASGGIIRLVDVAPEVAGGLDFIRALKEEAIVAVAHTEADYDQACEAFRAGARHAIHLYNGMTGATHRAPGVVGAVWDTPDITAELICDGFHIHPAILRTTFRLLGRRVIMISDSLIATGLPDGTSCKDAAGHELFMNNGKMTLADGTIAGSSTHLMECVRRVVSYGVPSEDAFYAASYAPAKLLGCENTLGSLEVGKQADLVVLNADLHPVSVLIKGKPIDSAF